MDYMEDSIVYIKTNNGYDIQKMIDTLKEVLEEVKLDFIRDPNQESELKKNKNNGNNSDSDSESESDEEDNKKKKKNKKIDSDTDKKSSMVGTEKAGGEKGTAGTVSKKSHTGGIKIVALDARKTLLINIKLYAHQFDEFYVKTKSYNIGLDLIQLDKFMKSIDKQCVMTMRIDKDDEQHLKIELENKDKNETIRKYKQKLLDIDDDKQNMPPTATFDLSVVMSTQKFRQICQYMNRFSEYIEITCTAKEITFRAKGDIGETEETIKHSDDEESTLRILCMNRENKKGLIMVQAIYNLKNLVTFGKCVNLCSEMQLHLKNDYPLFINFPIGNIGRMLVGLSPVDPDTINKDADYDDTYDKYYTAKKPIMKNV
jgi:proliferating cell nuclear antigen PCNA